MDNRIGFQRKVSNRFFFGAYLLFKLPLAFIAGVRLQHIDNDKAIATIRFRWINQNPFNSMYFAAQAMAAELSTGILALSNVYNVKPSVSMLVTDVHCSYYKKAVSNIRFVCEDGSAIYNAVEQTKKTGEGIEVVCISKAFDEENTLVSEFKITWSFKAKKQ